MSDNVIVIIPAYQEAARIGAVIDAVFAARPGLRVVVIDDGSADDTAEVARRHGATVLRLPTNQGYGVALQAGYCYAARAGADAVVQLDADGQHDPASIPDLLAALASPDVDVVIGSRWLGDSRYPMPALRRWGQLVFRAILNRFTSYRYTDPTSGFQAIKGRALWFYTSDAFPYDYPDADVLLMLNRAGLRCIEVPARFHPSPPGKISMHDGYKPFYYVLRMLLSLALTLIRPQPKPRGVRP